ncbi:MAG: hypothetical protein IJP37_06695 [Clostridia bacterium]|nr:hypothetical protein [Clostridia bacterium]
MLVTDIVLLCCFYLILPILYFTLRSEAKPRMNLCLGVTLPYAHLEDDKVGSIKEEFKRRLRNTLLLLIPWPLFSLLLPGFSLGFSLLMMWLLLAIIAMFLPYFRAHKELKAYQHRLESEIPEEDAHWHLGMFYRNPKDRRTVVPHRVGMGTTVNLARPGGKVLMIIALAAILCIPCFCGWVIAEEYTPITAELSQDALVITHLTRKEIPLGEITAVTLLPELPSTRRVAGSGMEHLLKGTFDVDGYGRCTLHLDPTAPPYLAVCTKETTHLINCSEELYENLSQRLHQNNSPKGC